MSLFETCQPTFMTSFAFVIRYLEVNEVASSVLHGVAQIRQTLNVSKPELQSPTRPLELVTENQGRYVLR